MYCKMSSLVSAKNTFANLGFPVLLICGVSGQWVVQFRALHFSAGASVATPVEADILLLVVVCFGVRVAACLRCVGDLRFC